MGVDVEKAAMHSCLVHVRIKDTGGIIMLGVLCKVICRLGACWLVVDVVPELEIVEDGIELALGNLWDL